MFEISSDCFTFISLHVVTFYFFSYLTDEKIKEAAGYANDRAEFVFFFFFSVGLLLYMYEYVAFMPLWKAHVAYLSIIVWIMLNWFYFRPKQIRKQQQQLDDIIDRLQHICDQKNRS